MFNVTRDNDHRRQKLLRVYEKCVVPSVPRTRLSNPRPSILRSSYTHAFLITERCPFRKQII